MSSAGDFNADGIDDLMIGNGPTIQMVFGRKSTFPAVVDVKIISKSEGLAILGIENEPSPNNVALKSVNKAGDVNGDGFDDIVVGSPRNERTTYYCEYGPRGGYKGSSYVLFGGGLVDSSINVTEMAESEGVKFSGNEHQSKLGRSTSGIGDLNGDGFQDFAVSRIGEYWYYYDYCLDSYHSETYVIFGSDESNLSEVTVDSLNGSNGFVIADDSRWFYDYTNVSAAGDVNGDGVDDMSFCYSYNCSIVFGSTAPFEPRLRINLNNNPNKAVKMQSAGVSSHRRVSNQPLKDFNGDGIDDFLFSAEKLAVVYGREEGFSLVNDVLKMTNNEVFFIESSTHEMSQFSGIGDFNQDGLNDFVLGQPGAFGGRGTSYVIYGVRDLIYKSSFEE